MIYRFCKNCKISMNLKGKKVCPKCASKISFQCKKCSAEYSSYTGVSGHIQSRCGRQLTACKKCGKNCHSIVILKNHLLSCGMPIIRCTYCSFKSKRRGRMNAHMKMHVPDGGANLDQDDNGNMNIAGMK